MKEVPQEERLSDYYLHLPSGKVVGLANLAVKNSFSRPDIPVQRKKIVILDPKNLEMPELSEDLADLGLALRGPYPELSRGSYPKEDFSKWSKEKILKVAKWIISFLPEPENPREMLFNEKIIARANHLGLLPSPRQIGRPSLFASSSNFYRELEEKRTSRRFHDLTPEKAREFISERTKQLGRMPREWEIERDAQLDPSKPSTEVLRARVGSLTSVSREQGYVNVKHTKGEGYKVWGVEYSLVNNHLPNSQEFRLFSSVHKGPGWSPTIRRFKSLPNFHNLITESQKDAIAKLKQGIEDGNVPSELFNDAESDLDFAVRYVRYEILQSLVPWLFEKEKTILSSPNISTDNFISGLQQRRRGITYQTIQSESERFGVLKNVWNTDYLHSLRIDQVVASKLEELRGELSEDDQLQMDYDLTNAAEFIAATGIKAFRAFHVDYLRRKRQISGRSRFDKIFVDQKFFFIAVQSRVEQIKSMLRNGLTNGHYEDRFSAIRADYGKYKRKRYNEWAKKTGKYEKRKASKSVNQ